MARLGDIYAKGVGVQKDRTEAITWYGYAAECGDAEAREKLWDIEQSMRKKPISRAHKGKAYNDKATLELCRYLYIACKTGNSIEPAQVPEGMKLDAAGSGSFKAPEYDGAIVRKYLSQGADPNASVPYEQLSCSRSFGGSVSPMVLVANQRDTKTLDAMIAHGMCVNDAQLGLAARALMLMDRRGSHRRQSAFPEIMAVCPFPRSGS